MDIYMKALGRSSGGWEFAVIVVLMTHHCTISFPSQAREAVEVLKSLGLGIKLKLKWASQSNTVHRRDGLSVNVGALIGTPVLALEQWDWCFWSHCTRAELPCIG